MKHEAYSLHDIIRLNGGYLKQAADPTDIQSTVKILTTFMVRATQVGKRDAFKRVLYSSLPFANKTIGGNGILRDSDIPSLNRWFYEAFIGETLPLEYSNEEVTEAIDEVIVLGITPQHEATALRNISHDLFGKQYRALESKLESKQDTLRNRLADVADYMAQCSELKKSLAVLDIQRAAYVPDLDYKRVRMDMERIRDRYYICGIDNRISAIGSATCLMTLVDKEDVIVNQYDAFGNVTDTPINCGRFMYLIYASYARFLPLAGVMRSSTDSRGSYIGCGYMPTVDYSEDRTQRLSGSDKVCLGENTESFFDLVGCGRYADAVDTLHRLVRSHTAGSNPYRSWTTLKTYTELNNGKGVRYIANYASRLSYTLNAYVNVYSTEPVHFEAMERDLWAVNARYFADIELVVNEEDENEDSDE